MRAQGAGVFAEARAEKAGQAPWRGFPPWGEWAIVAVLLAWFAWHTLVPAWRELNTDFPNYYLAARLYRSGVSLARIFDWVWFQRQKDHAGIAWGVVGWGPLTPFSALVVAPLAPLSPLTAKRCWLVFDLALLAATLGLLRSVCQLALRRIALVAFGTVVPLRTNFVFGQQYVLVLFLLTLACFLYLRRKEAACAIVLAGATVLKLYPGFFLVWFVLKGRWRAALAFLCALLAFLSVGVALLGPEVLRVYATTVLPRALTGEVQDPYHPGNNSLTVLLRRLFVREPAWNPRPLVDAVGAYVVLQPIVQAALLASGLAILTSRRRGSVADAVQWAGCLVFPLVLSTAASTYHLCPLIAATSIAVDRLLSAGCRRYAALLASLHAAACVPFYTFAPASPSGWEIFLGVPRLYALLAYWAAFVFCLRRISPPFGPRRPRERAMFVGGFVVLAGSGVRSAARHLEGVTATYALRLASGPLDQALVVAEPAASAGETWFSRMGDDGYLLDRFPRQLATRAPPGADFFSPTVGPGDGEVWVEIASRTSRVARVPADTAFVSAAELPVEVDDAEQPRLSADGRWLGFLREDHGRGSLWVVDRAATTAPTTESAGVRGAAPGWSAREVVDASHDVVEFSFLPDGHPVVAARGAVGYSLFVADGTGTLEEIAPGPTAKRYPAVSPDGRWLAYSELDGAAWKLRAMDLATHMPRPLTHADCNAISPTWTRDSTAVVYATDCGRGLGATVLARIQLQAW
jgi:hypothetical protein